MREEDLMRLGSDSYRIIGRPFMARAFNLALLGARTAYPNPLVGCVIVKDGVIVGEGYHSKAGEPHAEVYALNKAGEKARGATAYVTLEPCNHTGKTPPCSQALIKAGVERVVIGMVDPDSNASGGAKVLEQHGIKVEFVRDSRPYEELNRGWIKRLNTGLPYITAKAGLSLDSAISVRRDGPTVITGPSGAEVTRRLRATSDAVMVSATTANLDNPRLTVRGIQGTLEENQPKRIILVRSRIPNRELDLFNDGSAETIILAPDVHDHHLFEGYNAQIITYPQEGGLKGAFESLGTHGFNSVLVEPGQKLFTDMIKAELLDEFVMVTAGGFLGTESLKIYDGTAMLQYSRGENRVLDHRFVPFDAKIFGDVVATMWRPRGDRER